MSKNFSKAALALMLSTILSNSGNAATPTNNKSENNVNPNISLRNQSVIDDRQYFNEPTNTITPISRVDMPNISEKVSNASMVQELRATLTKIKPSNNSLRSTVAIYEEATTDYDVGRFLLKNDYSTDFTSLDPLNADDWINNPEYTMEQIIYCYDHNKNNIRRGLTSYLEEEITQENSMLLKVKLIKRYEELLNNLHKDLIAHTAAFVSVIEKELNKNNWFGWLLGYKKADISGLQQKIDKQIRQYIAHSVKSFEESLERNAPKKI